MILRFLRLFAAFRELELELQSMRDEADLHLAQLQRENAAKLHLQDRLRDLEADNLQLRRDLQDAQAKTIRSTETVADFLSQQVFGRRMFAEAPALPEKSAIVEPILRHRSQARDQVNEGTRAFYEQLAQQAQ